MLVREGLEGLGWMWVLVERDGRRMGELRIVVYLGGGL